MTKEEKAEFAIKMNQLATPLERVANHVFGHMCIYAVSGNAVDALYYEKGLDTIHRILDEQGKLENADRDKKTVNVEAVVPSQRKYKRKVNITCPEVIKPN